MNTGGVHGSALGADEVAATKRVLGFDPDKNFEVRDEVIEHTRKLVDRGREAHEKWQPEFDAWAEREPERKKLLDRLLAQELPEGWDADLTYWEPGSKPLATRAAFGKVLNDVAPKLPELWGGSADLAGSNNTTINGVNSFGPPSISTSDYTADWYGRVLHFGIREHAMGSILSGIVLHGPTRAFGGTFLQFSDYMRPAVRLASLMDIDTIYVWTHDSIGLGEDGPTHQPVEHLAALRAIPNLLVFRPGDTMETAECWELALASRDRPSVLALSRQAMPAQRKLAGEANRSARGGYVLAAATGPRRATLFASGSEVVIAMAARALLESEGIGTAVVSLPCWALFDAADAAYRAEVLGPPGGVRVAIEAAEGFGWERYIGPGGGFVGMSRFGASAPAGDLYKHFGITAEAAVAAVKARL